MYKNVNFFAESICNIFNPYSRMSHPYQMRHLTVIFIQDEDALSWLSDEVL